MSGVSKKEDAAGNVTVDVAAFGVKNIQALRETFPDIFEDVSDEEAVQLIDVYHKVGLELLVGSGTPNRMDSWGAFRNEDGEQQEYVISVRHIRQDLDVDDVELPVLRERILRALEHVEQAVNTHDDIERLVCCVQTRNALCGTEGSIVTPANVGEEIERLSRRQEEVKP